MAAAAGSYGAVVRPARCRRVASRSPPVTVRICATVAVIFGACAILNGYPGEGEVGWRRAQVAFREDFAWHHVAFRAAYRASIGTLCQVRQVSPDRIGLQVALQVRGRRWRLGAAMAAAAVASATHAAQFQRAVRVQRPVDDAAVRANHVRMALGAIGALRMRWGWGETVAARAAKHHRVVVPGRRRRTAGSRRVVAIAACAR